MSTETDEIASEIATKMAVAACGEARQVATAIAAKYNDSQLQEVRSVLTRLAPRTNVDADGHCWCSKNLQDDAEPHDKTCRLTRTLWQRLQPMTADDDGNAYCRQVHLENERSYRIR